MKPGIDIDGSAKNEADHFMRCPGCGQWFDMRELGHALAHLHDAKIVEISEGAAPGIERTLQ